MIVGIDARAFGWAGLGRYTRNLLHHLVRIPRRPQLVVFAPHVYAQEIAALPNLRVVPVSGSYYSLAEQTVLLSQLLREERLDLMHFLHFNAPVLYRRPSIVTIHDLTRFLFPAQKQRGAFHQWAYEEVFRASVVHAQRIIAVSAHTRADLLRFFPEVAGRTVVIPEGVDQSLGSSSDAAGDPATRGALGITGPYILFVGVWMNHKNIPRLLQAFRLLRMRGYQGSLVMTGSGRSHDVDVPALIRSEGLQNVVLLPGYVSDQDLPSLYRGADLLVFPSLYEGFGFPPLEALACGTPVVASHIASLPEILGDAAEYIDPLSTEDLARGIDAVLSDPDYAAELVLRGRARVQHYTWDRCAEETARLYADALVPGRVRADAVRASLG